MNVRVLAALVLVLAVALGTACAIQDRFLYYPDAARTPPSLPGVTDEAFTADDGAMLVTWRATPTRPGAPTIVYFHGNARNLAAREAHFARFRDAGWGLAALSYRGYGGSDGSPSEAANVADALAFYEHVVAGGVPADQIVLYGESLGSGMAVRVAAARPIAGLVLHAPYASVEDVAARIAPFLFPRRVLRDRYRSIDHIAQVRAPILWIHGDADRLIPVSHGQRLFDAAVAPKTAHIAPGVDHRGVFDAGIFDAVTRPWVDDRAMDPALDGT